MITYPLSMPTRAGGATGLTDITIRAKTVVGIGASPYTASQQVNVWQGQWWELEVAVPPIKDPTKAAAWITFLVSLNGIQGTFLANDPVNKASRGTIAGTAQVGVGVVANSTALVTQTHTGQLEVGDWIQIGTGASSKLHQVLKRTDSTHYDIFPRTRSAYAQGTGITYTAAQGLFRMVNNDQMEWTINVARFYGLHFRAAEAL